ncbi:hypothetical protein K788_0002073 (plasmid) [Paraburkholderia caribensis MBA4]|uniref:Uncharacterized protein n=1 Tax=Paraburkholderia caribensis MBA4 TaxID=1323664 RepID=A0A0P0RQ34_9BURK|nr:hypothetical protein K788_0002073 [Paraburkholderia caribensis MBA4]
MRRPEFASQVMHRKVSSRHPHETVRGAVQKWNRGLKITRRRSVDQD